MIKWVGLGVVDELRGCWHKVGEGGGSCNGKYCGALLGSLSLGSSLGSLSL